jgi:hypothetical protein
MLSTSGTTTADWWVRLIQSTGAASVNCSTRRRAAQHLNIFQETVDIVDQLLAARIEISAGVVP